MFEKASVDNSRRWMIAHVEEMHGLPAVGKPAGRRPETGPEGKDTHLLERFFHSGVVEVYR
jgi:hypothetical protein